MKHNKIFRILAAVIIISLLALVIPATPAAAASLSLSPTSGRGGSTLTVTGTGFTTGTFVQIDFNYSPKKWIQLMGAETTFSVSFTVPNVSPGTYLVRAVDGALLTLIASTYFTVITASIDIDPDDGQVDTEVEIDGTDFDSREDITIEYDGDEVDIASGDDDTDSDGDFFCTIIIPESAAGEHTITVTGDESGVEAEAEFTVEPEISISSTEGAAGTSVTVSGTGFKKYEDITIYFAGSEIYTTIETDNNGSFSGVFTVPAKAKGTYKVKASDGTNKESVDFIVTAGASLDTTTGNIGTTLTISGTGFIASGTITIKYDDTQVATTTTDTNGAFSVTFDVPASQHGDHTIIASDGITTKQFTFTMESQPPPTPPLLLPEDGIKAEPETYFDWEDVTDDSGVTSYTLQIATDKNFTPASIVLEKEGLTSSEYTITKAEELPSTKKEAPYYWRVQAVDGAFNESGWTTLGSFYVGFAFEFTGWVMWTAIGIGGLLLFFIGFWVGRRTGYY